MPAEQDFDAGWIPTFRPTRSASPFTGDSSALMWNGARGK
jgi:hypothetical protein